MYRIITTVISFRMESTFKEWVKIFYSQEALRIHSEFDIKPLFRVLCKDDHKMAICIIHQPPEGNIQRFVHTNSERIKSHKVDLLTMEESSWI